MKILNVLSSMDPVAGGGIMERVHQLSRYLIKKGHHCAIFATAHGWDQSFIDKIEGLEAASIPCISDRYMIPKGAGHWLENNICRFDILHLAGNWSPINVIAYKVAKKHNVPYVFSAMGWLKIDGRSRFLKHIFRLLWTRPMLRDADAVVAISPREIDDYMRLDVPKEKIKFIPNGIVTDELVSNDDKSFRDRYGLDNRKIILFIGRLSPIKGADLLVEAFSFIVGEFPDYQLLIFGNDHGGFQSEVERKIEALNMRNSIKIFPPIFGVEKSWAYHAAELFVIPSRYDTMTIVALEAAACGCPVLITDRCDFAAIGENGVGLVVPCETQAIAGGMHRLLNNPVGLKQMGAIAEKYVLQKYHWDKISDDFIRLFENVRELYINMHHNRRIK